MAGAPRRRASSRRRYTRARRPRATRVAPRWATGRDPRAHATILGRAHAISGRAHAILGRMHAIVGR
eukprot:4666400-Prymnesium_polylepis.1